VYNGFIVNKIKLTFIHIGSMSIKVKLLLLTYVQCKKKTPTCIDICPVSIKVNLLLLTSVHCQEKK